MNGVDTRSPKAFVIMQIGDLQLDQMHDAAIVPAVRACGLEPKRVDKHNEGGLLKSEIVRFIHDADIIVADLTNERPNCYLEVGYAMGLNKFRNLILTARADHSPGEDSDARVHFDLAGYDVMFWDPSDIDGFRQRLERKIRSRQNLLSAVKGGGPFFDGQWLDACQLEAQNGLRQAGLAAFMEVSYSPLTKLAKGQNELLNAARAAQIETFGWPLGMVLDDTPLKPAPRADCIVANVKDSEDVPAKRYDYWILRENGDFYTLLSLYEDTQWKQKVFVTTRIVRVTEAFLHCAGLYKQLGLDRSDRINLRIRHSGLKERVLESPTSLGRLRPKPCLAVNEVSTQVEVSIQQIEEDIVQLVKQACGELFVVFDFTEIPHSIFERSVTGFVAGTLS